MKIESWTNIPGSPRSSFAHVLHDAKLFIIGGHPGQFHQYEAQNFSSECHVLDLTNERWSAIAPLPVPAQGLRIVANGGYLYAFGGFSPDSRINPRPWPAASKDSIYRYSIGRDAWESIGAMPRRRSSYVCATLLDKVYFFGGWDATPNELGDNRGRFVKAIDVFHLPSETFLPTCLEFDQLPLRRALSATVQSGRAVLAGGLGTDGFMSSDLFADVVTYTPPAAEAVLEPPPPGCETCRSALRRYVQGTIELLPYLPEPLFSPGIGLWGGDLLVAGGVHSLPAPYGGTSARSLRLLQQGASRWENLPVEMSEGKSFVEVQSLPDGRVALIGGHRGSESDSLPSTLIEVLSR